jgi:hypothetical protein
MSTKDKTLIVVYLGLAVAALVGTWSQNLAFAMQLGSFPRFVLGFVPAALANHAAASIFIDILLLGLAALIFMSGEAKRLSIPHFWLFVVIAFAIAGSVAFALFMAVRQARIASNVRTAAASA